MLQVTLIVHIDTSLNRWPSNDDLPENVSELGDSAQVYSFMYACGRKMHRLEISLFSPFSNFSVDYSVHQCNSFQ